jgi:hypothetical protein
LAWVNPSYHDNPATWVIRGELTRINLLNLRLKSLDKNNSLKKNKENHKSSLKKSMSNDEIKFENK